MCHISANEDMQSQLRNLAQEVVSDIAAADPARSRELLSAFVSELVLAVADESRREERRTTLTRPTRTGEPESCLSSRRRTPAASPGGPFTALPSAGSRTAPVNAKPRSDG